MADEMAGAGISARQRLERIEQMLSELSKNLDVRFLQLEHRVQVLETERAVEQERRSVDEEHRIQLATDLHDQRSKMDLEVQKIQDNQLSVMRLVKYGTAILAAMLITSDVIVRFFSR